MTWSSLLARVSRETGLSASSVRVLMTSYWKGLRSELLKVPSVSVPGWGTFRRVELKPRVVHPVKGSGKDLFVPTALSVRFRLASKMKKFLNKKGRSSR